MKKIIIAMLLFFAVAYVMIVHYFPDVQINKYPDIQTVHEDQAIQKGWIPAILPESAYDIAETHDLDSNTLFGKFRYRERDEKALIQSMKTLSDRNDTMEWGNFLFKVDREKNQVKYRNKPRPAR